MREGKSQMHIKGFTRKREKHDAFKKSDVTLDEVVFSRKDVDTITLLSPRIYDEHPF